MTTGNDVIGLQRAVVELVTDDHARAAWLADPRGYALRRLRGTAAEALARVDPAGMQAMTASHLAKKQRFDYRHRLHHELEARREAEAAGVHEHAPRGDHHSHDYGGHAHPHGGQE